MDPLLGRVLQNRYRIESFLGRGGMASVYLATDMRTGQMVAIKLLHEDFAQDSAFIRRLRGEASRLQKFKHKNIVRYFGWGQDDLLTYLIMEYVHGTNLRAEIHRLRGTPMDWGRILQIMKPVCEALAYAHMSGYVHCDAKPSNIMIEDSGRVLLTDFGIARWVGESTSSMEGFGAPAYMAPEQVLGEKVSPQTDIYTLGVVLYELVTGGERPFTGGRARTGGTTQGKIRWEQRHLRPPSPMQINPRVPPAVDALILQCLDKDPRQRPDNALEFFETLEAALPSAGFEPTPKTLRNQGSYSPTGREPKPPETTPQPHLPSRNGLEKVSTDPLAGIRGPQRPGWLPWLIGGISFLACVALVGLAAVVIDFNMRQAQTAATQTALVAQANTSTASAAAAQATTTARAQATETAIARATATTQTRLALYEFVGTFLSDQFNDNTNDWETGSLKTSIWTGSQRISNGRLLWLVDTSKKGFAIWDWPGSIKVPFPINFYTEVTTRRTGGSASDCPGIWFRGNGQNFYAFETCDKGIYRMYSHKDAALDQWETLLEPTYTDAIQADKFNKLAVMANGGYFELFINGQMVNTLEDTRLSSGRLGLLMHVNSGDTPSFEFDDFVIRTP